MKRLLLSLCLTISVFGCESESTDTPEPETDATAASDSTTPMEMDASVPADATMSTDAGTDSAPFDPDAEGADAVFVDTGVNVDGAAPDMMLPPPEPTSEHAFMLPVPADQAHWKDLAYLAATAASAHRNHGRTVVIALPAANALGDSAEDYLRRFAPKDVTVLGAPDVEVDTENVEHVPAPDLESTTLALAANWTLADHVVVAPADHYGQALLAASLAGRLRAPLFFVDTVASNALIGAIERLGPQEVLTIGNTPELPLRNARPLPDVDAVITYLTERDYALGYFALVNPNDRDAGRSQKLSLTAAAYTTRRDGLTIPVATPIPADVAEGTHLATAIAALNDRYAHLGRHPEHLALVGAYDTIPIERRRSLFDVPEREWPVTDIPYGEIDDDPFRDIAVGRIFTDNLYRGSLLAARTVTYELLLDGTWENQFIESGLWGFDELRAIMLNVGFDAPEHLTEAQINQRASLEVSAILHKDHSHCTVLGHAFTVETEALYAPAVVISRGCSVAGLDLVATASRTVPGNMLGRGAVAFIGAPRNSIAGNTVTEVAFFNYMLEGKTLGQAMRAGFNNATVHYLDENSNAGMRYVLDNEMLFGDPALVYHVPSDPMTAPATATLEGDTVTVTGPESWTQVQFVPEQLAEWNYEGDLFMYVGHGAEPKTYWSGRHDNEDLYYTVALPLPGDFPAATLTELNPMPEPLGWRGGHYIDLHQDGTKTIRWRVRLLDYNMQTGVMNQQLDEAEFRLE